MSFDVASFCLTHIHAVIVCQTTTTYVAYYSRQRHRWRQFSRHFGPCVTRGQRRRLLVSNVRGIDDEA